MHACMYVCMHVCVWVCVCVCACICRQYTRVSVSEADERRDTYLQECQGNAHAPAAHVIIFLFVSLAPIHTLRLSFTIRAWDSDDCRVFDFRQI